MCVNPRDICATFLSFLRSCGKQPENSFLDFLPEEVVNNILDSMEYEQISKLRSVNRWLNFKCSKYLNEAYLKIKKDLENFIFESFDDLKVDGKLPREIIETFGLDNSYIDYGLLKPTINKILFVNKILLILIILRDGIFRYMFYRNYKTAGKNFVFIYGNCLDWAAQKLKQAKHQSVTLRDTACLIPPPEITQHLDQIIATNKSKICFSRLKKKKEYMRDRYAYEHVQPVVMEVEMLFFATHSTHALPPEFNPSEHYHAIDIYEGYIRYLRDDLFSRAIFYTAGEAIEFYWLYMTGKETEFRVLFDPVPPFRCNHDHSCDKCFPIIFCCCFLCALIATIKSDGFTSD